MEKMLEVLHAHRRASADGDADIQALRTHHPGKPGGFQVRRILGAGDCWVTGIVNGRRMGNPPML